MPGFLRGGATVVLLLACLAVQARDLHIGQLVDYGGELGEASRDYVAGAKVYFDWLNKRGGVNGLRIRHTVIDAGTEPQAVRAKTRELLDERRVDVLFGYVGDEAVVEALREPEVAAGAIALVAPLAGAEPPRGSEKGVFYARPGYEAEVRQVVGHFRALQITRFAVVRSAREADRAVAESVTRALAAHGLAPAGILPLASDVSGRAQEIEAVLALRAQALLVIAETAPAAEFIKRYRPRDPGALVVGLSTLNHRVLFQILGPKLAHGVMVTQVVPNPMLGSTPLVKEHLDTIRIFRDEPPSHLTLEGFIAAKVLVEGLRQAGASPTRESIAGSLRRLGRVDLNGVVVDLTRGGRGSSNHVDLAMIRRNGELLQ